MKKRNDRTPARARARQEKKPARTRGIYPLMLVCGLLLVSGFFFAGRQHFSSMDYGMKNSRLRKQIDELEAEKRRLLLTREISLSPAEIKKAAKKNGLVDPTTPVEEIAQVASAAKENVAATPQSIQKPLVVKTAAVSAVASTFPAAYPKPEKIARQIKTTLSTE